MSDEKKEALIEWLIVIWGVVVIFCVTKTFYDGFNIAHELELCEYMYEKIMIMIMIMCPGMVFGCLPAGYYCIKGLQKLVRDAVKLLIIPPLGLALIFFVIAVAGFLGIFCLPCLLIKRIFKIFFH